MTLNEIKRNIALNVVDKLIKLTEAIDDIKMSAGSLEYDIQRELDEANQTKNNEIKDTIAAQLDELYDELLNIGDDIENLFAKYFILDETFLRKGICDNETDIKLRLCTAEEFLGNLKNLVENMKENPDSFQTVVVDSYDVIKEQNNE